MPEDAPGMGTSTAALPLPALPDKAAQPGASSVGRMVQHIPAPGQPPTTCQFPQLLQHRTRDTTQDRGRGSLTAPSHCCYGWAGSGSPPGIPGEEGDISAPWSLPGTPGHPPPRLNISSSIQLWAQRERLTSCCHGAEEPWHPQGHGKEGGLQLGHPWCGGRRRERWPCVLS